MGCRWKWRGWSTPTAATEEGECKMVRHSSNTIFAYCKYEIGGMG